MEIEGIGKITHIFLDSPYPHMVFLFHPPGLILKGAVKHDE